MDSILLITHLLILLLVLLFLHLTQFLRLQIILMIIMMAYYYLIQFLNVFSFVDNSINLILYPPHLITINLIKISIPYYYYSSINSISQKNSHFYTSITHSISIFIFFMEFPRLLLILRIIIILILIISVSVLFVIHLLIGHLLNIISLLPHLLNSQRQIV